MAKLFGQISKRWYAKPVASNYLLYSEPSKVAGQKFATHVAFAPQLKLPSRPSAFAHRAQKPSDLQSPTVKHVTVFDNACGRRSILPTGPQCPNLSIERAS